MTAQGVALLGSTGSIGTTALRVLSRHRDRFVVRALTAHGSAELLRAQAAEWQPSFVGLVQGDGVADATWRRGPEALVEAATRHDVEIVLNAVVGAAGLDATMAALDAGTRVALANQESPVMGGALVQAAAQRGGGTLVPWTASTRPSCNAGRTHHGRHSPAGHHRLRRPVPQ